MKRILAVLLSLMLLVGCSSGGGSTNVESKNNAGNNTAKNTTENGDADKQLKIGIIQFMDHVSLDQARIGFEDTIKNSGINAEIVYKNANGEIALTSQIPQSLKDCDLIYAIATPAVQGAQNVITDKPIIFSAVTDPVGAGLVKSIENPEGNISGVSDYINPKSQIEDFLKIYPDVKTFGVMYNTGEQNSEVQIEDLKNVLAELRLNEPVVVGVNNINDIGQAINSMVRKVDAVFAITDNMVASAAPVIAPVLVENKIPSLSIEEGQVSKGLLISQGISYYEQGEVAANMALKILVDGADVSKTPVEYTKKIIKKINKDTAEGLGLDLTSPELSDAELLDTVSE